MTPEPTVWTIGHSTRPFDEFLALLVEHHIGTIADVRRYPGSRRYPQYGPAALPAALAEHRLDYRWMPALGGRRKTHADSPNRVWRNASFRGYADYMQTAAFGQALDDLLTLAGTARVAVMCAEAVWWRCHRSMIADALKARGIVVLHIMAANSVTEHPWTAPARIVDGKLTYATDP